MRHPDIAVPGIVPESAMEMHRGRGWLRVTEALSNDERDQIRVADYASAPDLDQPADEKPAKQQTKEK